MEERYIYHWDDYDYVETIYDTKEEKEYTDMQCVTHVLNERDQENQVLEKALELVCEDMYNLDCDCAQSLYKNDKDLIQTYINIAKEMMKSE